MNPALLKALENERKEEMKSMLLEILPPIIKEAMKKPKEDRLLKKYEVGELWGVSKATCAKYLNLAIELEQIKPVDFQGTKRYLQSAIMNVNLKELKYKK